VAKTHHRLTDLKIKTLPPGRISDGLNLYLETKPDGVRRYWIFRDTSTGKLRWKSLGAYPKVSLKAARQRTQGWNDQLALGQDPWQAKARVPSFSEIANEYIDQILVTTNPRSKEHWHRSIELYASALGPKPVNQLDTTAILSVLKPIWKTKAETASRLRGRIAKILGYAKAKGFRDGPNPAAWAENLEMLLPTQNKATQHFKALPYDQLPEFVASLRTRQGLACICLEFIILCATRCGETTGAEWQEVDFDRGVWTIPARRTKTRKPHVVPLSEPALKILRELAATKVNRFIFPGIGTDKPISGMAVYKFVKPCGITIHGMRSAFRDWCGNETEFPRDLVEEALSHSLGAVERAYRRGQAVVRRRVLMTAWARYLNGEDAKVIDLTTRRVG
jgi:integrase